jgi:predicted ATPase
MLQKLKLANFKCYLDHEMEFHGLTIIVGKNNAGKSTLIEALRLIQLAIVRYRHLGYHSPPEWTDTPKVEKGVYLPQKGYDFIFENVFHNYSDPPANITAEFSEGEKIVVYIGADKSLFSILYDTDGSVISSKSDALGVNFPEVNIMPPIGPLLRDELILDADYVRRNVTSHLSSIHFRNQLNIYYTKYFDKFKSLAEESWKDLRINELVGKGGLPREELFLMVQDGNFAAEISWMGHGLQMWLQTMWFLTRVSNISTIILDEPDVYMHPDLQRNLIRRLRGNYEQIIIATHSVEIISEVDPENILVVDKEMPKSVFTSSIPAVQKIITSIGSIQNI